MGKKFKKFVIHVYDHNMYKGKLVNRAAMSRLIINHSFQLGYQGFYGDPTHTYFYCSGGGYWYSGSTIQDCQFDNELEYKVVTYVKFLEFTKDDVIVKPESTITKAGVDWGNRSGRKYSVVLYDEVDEPIMTFSEWIEDNRIKPTLQLKGDNAPYLKDFMKNTKGSRVYMKALQPGFTESMIDAARYHKIHMEMHGREPKVEMNSEGRGVPFTQQMVKNLMIHDQLQSRLESIMHKYIGLPSTRNTRDQMHRDAVKELEEFSSESLFNTYVGGKWVVPDCANKNNKESMKMKREVNIETSLIEVGQKVYKKVDNIAKPMVVDVIDIKQYRVSTEAEAVFQYTKEKGIDVASTSDLVIRFVADAWYEVQ